MFSTAKKLHSDPATNGKRSAKSAANRPHVINGRAAVPPQPLETPHTFHSDLQAPDRMKVAFNRRDMSCELGGTKHPILTGAWDWEIRVDDHVLDSSAEVDSAAWESNCWEENIDVSYSELQLNLPSGVQIQRQMLLARRDRFAFWADVIEMPRDVNAVYRGKLQLSDQLTCVSSPNAREIGLCKGQRAVARVLPISLPEWRRQPGGELESQNDLTITQPIEGMRGHIALFIDLDPQRYRRQLTWRQLTVAESLQAVARDVAAGYRIQIGREQWLIYRSLAPAANRTVLGQNFSTEFVVARFRPNGIAAKILEIL